MSNKTTNDNFLVHKADRIYAEAKEDIAQFRFDEKVAEVFPDMIQRSVPGYALIQDMIGVLAKRYAQANSNIYDLGCSLGASSLSMLGNVQHKSTQLIAIDNSSAMIKGADKALSLFCEHRSISNAYHLLCENIEDIYYENASIINLNFTLQFIAPEHREKLLQKLYLSLKPGGILILSEKVFFSEKADQLQSDLHHDFKKANGYSDLEISQKRSSLEDVLIRDSEAQHHQRFKQAGFEQSITWFQCFNFMSLLAIKA
jgi:tRNA (cmo5U34)-methyltransferase